MFPTTTTTTKHQWRGYFPVGNEMTSGKPDMKEGLYMGQETSEEDERAMHGINHFLPDSRLNVLVPSYLEAMTRLGHQLLSLISLSLGLPRDFFETSFKVGFLFFFSFLCFFFVSSLFHSCVVLGNSVHSFSFL